MDKTNLELFQQALNEGLSNRFDSLAEEYTGEIVCSRKHKLAMRTIVYGKAGGARAWSPRMRRVVAILVAAALLLKDFLLYECRECAHSATSRKRDSRLCSACCSCAIPIRFSARKARSSCCAVSCSRKRSFPSSSRRAGNRARSRAMS